MVYIYITNKIDVMSYSDCVEDYYDSMRPIGRLLVETINGNNSLFHVCS
jgi:hypothetical protein